MVRQWESVWEFNTANLKVVCEVADCEEDPANSFEFDEDIEAVRNGRVAWFDARVRVLGPNDEELGSDYLGCCAYKRAEELFRHHSTYTAELRRLHARHAQALKDAKWGREHGWNNAANLATAADLCKQIAEVKKILANNASLNPPVNCREYGPGMVRLACEEARKTLKKLQTIRVR